LTAFKTDHGKTWETVLCLVMLAQVLEEKGDPEAAVRAYRELAALPGLPADLKRDGAVQEGKLLLRAGKFADAEKKFQDLLASVSAQDAQWAALHVLLTQSQIGQDKLDKAEEHLRTALHAGDDPTVKAMAFNTLGDYCLKKGNPEYAFWNYLKVDTLYGQDREEQARALYHLSKLFESVKKDPLRGQQCMERLKQLEGTEHQRKAAAGAKP
jgi:lipopolysaccharide biosynthesis regulator YciM